MYVRGNPSRRCHKARRKLETAKRGKATPPQIVAGKTKAHNVCPRKRKSGWRRGDCRRKISPVQGPKKKGSFVKEVSLEGVVGGGEDGCADGCRGPESAQQPAMRGRILERGVDCTREREVRIGVQRGDRKSRRDETAPVTPVGMRSWKKIEGREWGAGEKKGKGSGACEPLQKDTEEGKERLQLRTALREGRRRIFHIFASAVAQKTRKVHPRGRRGVRISGRAFRSEQEEKGGYTLP